MSDLQQQIDALAARVAQLEAERWSGPPRIGPRPQTGADIEAQTQRIVEAVKASVKTDGPTPPPVDRTKLCTTDGRSPEAARAGQTNETGQHASYIVLCEDERKRGFVRPYRDSYKHIGPLTQLVNGETGEDSHQVRAGGCGTVTTMGRALSETYARDPKFYSHTFCVRCNTHPPVSEFVWTADGQQVGS